MFLIYCIIMLAHVIIVVIIVHVCSDELQVRAVMKPIQHCLKMASQLFWEALKLCGGHGHQQRGVWAALGTHFSIFWMISTGNSRQPTSEIGDSAHQPYSFAYIILCLTHTNLGSSYIFFILGTTTCGNDNHKFRKWQLYTIELDTPESFFFLR